ncbi:MAG TPA: hypothetical protein VJ865_13405 [Gemmatimonadaceae bacterium]|nr:hypothetical protein [Gemmatimonadaceae bacterium]
MRAIKPGIGLGVLSLLLGLATATSGAQASRRGPPIIRIYSDNGVDYVGTTSYITPRIELSENAYVFAVEMDMDGQIQVLHPDFPGISVRISGHKSLQLPNFFTGFNSSRYGRGTYNVAMDRDYYDYYGADDSRGTIIALASRAPFNLERVESNGDWDIAALRRLIEHRSPLSAANELARYLGQAGEPIGRDYLRFDGGQRYSYPYYDAYSYYSPCSSFYGYSYLPAYSIRQAQAFALYSQLLAAGRGVRILGYDQCGVPIFIPGNVNGGQGTPIGHFPPPRHPGDTTVFPKSRLPKAPVPRGSTVFANTLDEGMPRTRAGGLPQMGDVTIKASPTGRRGEPKRYIEDYGGGLAVPQGRIPVERVIVPRGEASAGSTKAVPTYRAEPRAEAAPARMPERPREAPPQVIHERPSSPPPPPPRVEVPVTKSDPPRTPPPSRDH